jgi:hypothetical protein
MKTSPTFISVKEKIQKINLEVGREKVDEKKSNQSCDRRNLAQYCFAPANRVSEEKGRERGLSLNWVSHRWRATPWRRYY